MKKLLYTAMALGIVATSIHATVVNSPYDICSKLTGAERAQCIQNVQNEEPGSSTEWTGE